MGIGSLGFSEMAIIFVIALIVFGPRKLPELGRSLGSAMREFRRSLNEIQRELEASDPTRDVRNEWRSVRDETRSILGPQGDRRASPPETKSTSRPAHPGTHDEPGKPPGGFPPKSATPGTPGPRPPADPAEPTPEPDTGSD